MTSFVLTLNQCVTFSIEKSVIFLGFTKTKVLRSIFVLNSLQYIYTVASNLF